MKGRRAARRLAVDALYEAEIRDQLPLDTFELQQQGGRVVPAAGDTSEAADEPSEDVEETTAYARSLVAGVQEHHSEIDALIAKCADRWAIDRMPVVDRTLLRLATFELLWAGDVPVAVVINEAVELAKSLSTEDSGRFVNGLLGKIAESRGVSEPS
jgi:transcription antitermination protein NusB